MSILTILAYLFGSRWAIERVVADPRAVWVGLALVVSAGLARSYRSHDLAKQPWRLILPVVAALAISLLLYVGLAVKLLRVGGVPVWPEGFGSIAALVLLTSPLAWLYALPFERFFSRTPAVRARLLTLAIVAAWRVALIVRAVGVLLDDRIGVSLCLVLLSVDAVALAEPILPPLIRAQGNKPHRSQATPMLMGAMSGVEARAAPASDPGRALLTKWTVIVVVLGVVTFPVWAVGLDKQPASAVEWRRLVAAQPTSEAPTLDVWLLAGAAVVFFLALLPRTQRSPRLRTRIEDLLLKGEVLEALRLMSAHEQTAFPSGWAPPPEKDFRDPPRLLDIMDLLTREPTAPWVREVYLERFRGYLSDPLWYWLYDDDLERIAAILHRLPEGGLLAKGLLDAIPAFEKNVKKRSDILRSDQEDAVDHLLAMTLHPEPAPTGRREETVASLKRLADSAS